MFCHNSPLDCLHRIHLAQTLRVSQLFQPKLDSICHMKQKFQLLMPHGFKCFLPDLDLLLTLYLTCHFGKNIFKNSKLGFTVNWNSTGYAIKVQHNNNKNNNYNSKILSAMRWQQQWVWFFWTSYLLGEQEIPPAQTQWSEARLEQSWWSWRTETHRADMVSYNQKRTG